MDEQIFKPIKLTPPINATLITDGAGLEKLKTFFSKTALDKIIGYDKETSTCKDFFHRKDRTIQFGNVHEQYVIDLLAFVDGNSDDLFASQGYYGIKRNPKLQPVIDVIEPVVCSNEFLKVGVNLGFEYEQDYWCHGLRGWNIYSVDMVERCIWAGAHSLKDYDFYSMEEMVKRYFEMQVDKTLQTSFDLSTPLTQAQIDYAALDTRIPLGLRLKQLITLKKDGLEEVAQIENNAIGAFIDMHIHGQKIDREKWTARATKKSEELAKVITELDKTFVPLVGSKNEVITDEDIDKLKLEWKAFNKISDEEIVLKKQARETKDPELKAALLQKQKEYEAARKFKKEELKKVESEQGKLRTKMKALAGKAEGEALIVYGSPAQLLTALKLIKGLGSLEDTNDDTLEKFKDIPVIKTVQKYRELSKQVSTYGFSWVQEWITSPGAEHDGIQEGWLHPGDGRLHPKFNQYDAETGRSSSSQPNGQNIPQDPEVRSCFIADSPDESIRISVCCDDETIWSPMLNSGYACKKCGQACETKPEEYVIVTADMSGAELRIIAELSDSPTWIGAFSRDEDVHSVGTELMYPEKWPSLTVASLLHPDKWTLKDVKTELVPLFNPDGTPLMKEKKGKMVHVHVPPCAYFACKDNGELAREKCDCPEHKKLRDGNKSTNFLLAYGGTAHTLAERLGVKLEVAMELMALHEQKNPEVWAYLDKSGKEAKFKKEARSMYGRRRIFPEPNWEMAKAAIIKNAHGKIGERWEKAMRKDFGKNAKFKDVQKKMSEHFFLQNGRKPTKDELWSLTHNEVPSPKHISSCLKGMFERIERQGKNHCIQSTNADIIKIAMGCGFDKDGKPYLWHILPKLKARLLAMVHDELIVQCPKRLADKVAFEIGDAFRRAAAVKMKKVIMKFDFHIAPHWQK